MLLLTVSAWDRIVARDICPNLPFVLLHDKIPRYARDAINRINQWAAIAIIRNKILCRITVAVTRGCSPCRSRCA